MAAQQRCHKTLHITNWYHPNSGGIRTAYRALIRAAAIAEREFVLVVPGQEFRIETISRSCRVYHLPAPRLPFGDRRYRVFLPFRTSRGSTNSIRRVIMHESPDLVEVCDKYFLLAVARWLQLASFSSAPVKRPVLVGLSCERLTDTAVSFLPRIIPRSWVDWYLNRVFVPSFDFILANSEFTASELRNLREGLAGDWLGILPHGVDSNLFHPRKRTVSERERLISSFGGSKDSSLMVYAGRLSREKNLDLLLNSFAILSRLSPADHRLLIAGEGPLLSALKRQAADLGLAPRVHFLGHLRGRSDLASLLANSDAFVHCNPKEPFGIGPLEAMASGIPVVLPDRGGVVSYADSSNAWPTEPVAESFAQALFEIFEKPDSALLRCRAARLTAEAFDWAEVAPQWFRLYDSLVTRYRRGELAPDWPRKAPVPAPAESDGRPVRFSLDWFRAR